MTFARYHPTAQDRATTIVAMCLTRVLLPIWRR